MSKKGSLFLLIKSLTKAEKRHFKLSLSGDVEGNNYLLLFNAIDAQEELDEEAIKKKFKQYTFSKQLHVTKNYLTKLILKSLRSYHAHITKDAELKDLLREVEILFKKDLFDMCYYHLKKAEEMAIKYERHTALLDVYSWQRRLTLTTETSFNAPTPVSEILKKEAQTIQKVINLNEYWDLTVNQFSILSNREQIEQWKLKPAVTNPDYSLSLQAKMLHYYLNYTLNVVTAEPEKAGIASLNMIKLLEARPDRIKEDPNGYLTAIGNRLSLLIRSSSDADEIPELIIKAKNAPAKYGLKHLSKGTIKLIAKTYNVEMEYYRDRKDFVKGIIVAEETEQFIKQYHPTIPDDYKLLLSYQIAYITFMSGQLRKSLTYLNSILNEVYDKQREDIQSFVRLLYLIIHFELGNIVVLKYSVESVRRFLKKKRTLYPYELILLKFFSKASTTPEEEYKYLLAQLKTDLFKPENSQNMDNALDYLDFKGWLESKKLFVSKN